MKKLTTGKLHGSLLFSHKHLGFTINYFISVWAFLPYGSHFLRKILLGYLFCKKLAKTGKKWGFLSSFEILSLVFGVNNKTYLLKLFTIFMCQLHIPNFLIHKLYRPNTFV